IPENQVHLHDGWIALLISAVAGGVLIDRPLMQYRQSPRQHTGAHPPTGVRMLMHQAARNERSRNMAAHVATVEWLGHLRDRLRAFDDRFPVDDRTLQRIEEKMDHHRVRIAMPAPRWLRVPAVLEEAVTLRYHRYSIGVWAAAKDLAAY
ncbi:MAG: hypothetical protein JOZ41_03690, partial [Chloroflexi bacterium]|nr:hypothetical protein [Chloroflexota bacterium]